MKEGQTQEPVKPTPVKERDNLDLLELVCQLHSRSLSYPSQEMHHAYVEARMEMESRLNPPPSPVGIDELINEFYEAYRRFEKDPDEDETQYNRGVREGKSITYANVVSRMRNFFSASLPSSSGYESGLDKELLMMTSWIDKIGVDNTAITRGAAKIKIGSALKRMLEYNPYTPVTGESEAIGFAEWLNENDYKTGAGNEYWFKWDGMDVIDHPYTTYQLFNLYKQSKPESEAIEVVDGYTLINLDKRTLPKDGQKVEFENDHEETYEGYYIEKDGIFHVSDSVFFFSWHVHKWKAI